ncbi:MAG: helix-turn-helix domain-containing protein [Burkholderiales bacterium]
MQTFSGGAFANPGIRLAEVADRELLAETLRETCLKISKAARLLGISCDTLRYRIKKHALNC